jgi:hypothetical protein
MRFLIFGLLAGCSTIGAQPGPSDCTFNIVVDGGIPDPSAYDGGRPYGGDLPIDECQALCDPQNTMPSITKCWEQPPSTTALLCKFSCM